MRLPRDRFFGMRERLFGMSARRVKRRGSGHFRRRFFFSKYEPTLTVEAAMIRMMRHRSLASHAADTAGEAVDPNEAFEQDGMPEPGRDIPHCADRRESKPAARRRNSGRTARASGTARRP